MLIPNKPSSNLATNFKRWPRFCTAFFLYALLLPSLAAAQTAPTLQDQLASENPQDLVQAARSLGDARRGAILFYQPYMTCTQCHLDTPAASRLGPDLSRFEEKPTAAHLIESILLPSKTIRKGFETIVVVTDSGKTVTGLFEKETPDKLILKDSRQNFKSIEITKTEIDDLANGPSIMPVGLINQLASRQQFYDLALYLIEIAEQGRSRALELRPAPSLYAAAPLPEYEKNIDHSGMIGSLNDESYQRGQTIYNRLCINCHGTKEKPGSLPTSLRFANGKFKNGSDPYAMYQTLTKGFGMMVQQRWMVPEQKYAVIHYIRQAYLKPHNTSQYATPDAAYLDRLPKGSTRGPKPILLEPWATMDYGPTMAATIEIGNDATNFAYKGIAVRLDSGPGGVAQGRHWMLYDHDTLRVAGAWSGQGFIDFNGINFNGQHQIHPRIVGSAHFTNPIGPGWASPHGNFTDPRFRGRDDKPYGPLPRTWAHYKGLYHYDNRAVLSYTVGQTAVLESPGLSSPTQTAANASPLFTRTFNIGPRRREMILQVAQQKESVLLKQLTASSTILFGSQKPNKATSPILAGITGDLKNARWSSDRDGRLLLTIPAGREPLKFKLLLAQIKNPADLETITDFLNRPSDSLNLSPLLKGSKPRWGETLTTTAILGDSSGPFAVDVFTRPEKNPWFCRVRFTGFDFYPDRDRAAICTWDGDVWLVDGVGGEGKTLSWRRIASGLFQPLGLKIIDGKIYVSCRDQITILHDLNGDDEIDFYENFNNDHQVTEHFHEFAMGLQTDDEGNFYYAKSARHAKTALVPHHGTLLKVSKDGLQTEIVATGFRAANGVCINPDGSFFVTDQEGHWTPKNRINWVKKGGFYGNMWGYHDVTDTADSAMLQPLCWITNAFDRSPAELLWVDSDKWGPLQGSLLNMSYGYGKLFVVPHEKINGQLQGGMCQIPIASLPTGLIRGRFHPTNGQLYACGMFAWAGSQQQPGGFYRIRYTGRPAHLPLKIEAKQNGLALTFSDELDRASVSDLGNYKIKTWSLRRTGNYGSQHHDEKPLKVTAARLSTDGKTIYLTAPTIKPTWSMEIRYSLKAAGGQTIDGVIHNTIHNLGEALPREK